jgi:ribosomal protein S18 acetylase RimI-like enzyme
MWPTAGPRLHRRRPGGSLPGVSVKVEVVREANDEVAAAMRELVPQLSTTAGPPEMAAMQRIVGSEATTLLAARLDGKIVGFLALVMFPIPTGFRAWIEDVIVDETARGRGIGEALTKKALGLAEAAGARTVDLTTRPHREAAGRLYERVGFAERTTRNYRYTFDRPGS